MTDKEKAEQRFGFTQPDECVKVSQCVGCSCNKGKKCDVYGDKPLRYARATAEAACPRRKAVNK